MVYAFDLDGTLCTKTDGDYTKAEPMRDRINFVNDLYKNGHQVIIFTARGMGRTGNSVELAYRLFYDLTKKQLEEWGIMHHALFLGKPSFDLLIDDKAMSDKDFFKDGENK